MKASCSLVLLRVVGVVNVESEVDAAQFEGRFPPSVEFEIVIILVIAMAVIEIYRAVTRKDGVTDSVAIKGGNALQRMEHCFKRVWGYLLLDGVIVAIAVRR